ncbi:MAG: TIGR00282 family metallophosphoesterase [Candidatus Eisenbacteria sp.]|nr:TIGR00282 family metallophosphoesterase [Candidatus Eisenbacteria bacterium]
MRILFIGDIVGRVGRRAVVALLPGLVEAHRVDFTIANGENAAGGLGITERAATELLDAGVHVLTGGDHSWDRPEGVPFLDDCERILRPANYPTGAAGRGSGVYVSPSGVKVGVVNLQGRAFMKPLDCPFRMGLELVRSVKKETPIVVVDFHAEATSEKTALGLYLAGVATCVLGTHTHVQTADERLLTGRTAYITDVGMTGPADSVIGMQTEVALERFLLGVPRRYEVGKGPALLNAVVVDIEEETGAARSIERVLEHHDE